MGYDSRYATGVRLYDLAHIVGKVVSYDSWQAHWAAPKEAATRRGWERFKKNLRLYGVRFSLDGEPNKRKDIVFSSEQFMRDEADRLAPLSRTFKTQKTLHGLVNPKWHDYLLALVDKTGKDRTYGRLPTQSPNIFQGWIDGTREPPVGIKLLIEDIAVEEQEIYLG